MIKLLFLEENLEVETGGNEVLKLDSNSKTEEPESIAPHTVT